MEKTTYTLQATLVLTVDIEAEDFDEAEARLRAVLENHEANFGAWPDGRALVAGVEIEGEIDDVS